MNLRMTTFATLGIAALAVLAGSNVQAKDAYSAPHVKRSARWTRCSLRWRSMTWTPRAG